MFGRLNTAEPPAGRLTMGAQWLALLLMAVGTASCNDSNQTPGFAGARDPVAPNFDNHAEPILAEPLTQRHRFTDDVAVQVRVKPVGRPTEVVNIKDASNIAVVRFTVQPGVRFPWHSHPGLVMVSVTQGRLVFVYANDCVQRPYNAGEAFVDPGFGNVHYAFNPTGGETVIVATFLGVPPTGLLTIAASASDAAAFDAKCNVAAAMAHAH